MLVKARHILVETPQEALIARDRIVNGEDFGAVAQEVSKCPSRDKGGDLGFFGRGQMVPEFDHVAFSLEENQLTGPVKTQFGFHIIQRTG